MTTASQVSESQEGRGKEEKYEVNTRREKDGHIENKRIDFCFAIR